MKNAHQPPAGAFRNPLRLVSLAALQAANDRVVTELEHLGFYDDALYAVDVYLVPVSAAYGYQVYGGDRSIRIPAVSGSQLLDILRGRRTDLCDVLRHEYGHALADTHRGLFRSRRFSKVFGGPHESVKRADYDPGCHVSPYAAENPSEDFAELFALYLAHAGNLPRRYGSPAIRAKWRFIDALRRAVTSGRRRW